MQYLLTQTHQVSVLTSITDIGLLIVNRATGSISSLACKLASQAYMYLHSTTTIKEVIAQLQTKFLNLNF